MFHFISFSLNFWHNGACVCSVQAMTRTPPVYTVRWSSQISPRLNNRMGPPTPVPNAVSSASSMSILNFKHIHSNLYRNDNNNNHHCFSTSITNNNINNTDNNNNYSSSNDSSYVMNIVNCNQYKSLTNRLDDAVIDTTTTNTYHRMSVFALIANNKISCLFIALWMYKFLAVEIQ